MHILIWSQHFWPEHFRINEQAQALATQSDKVTVLTGKPNYPQGNIFPDYKVTGIQHQTYQAVNIVRIPLFPRKKGKAISLFLNYISFILSGYIMAPFALKQKTYDAVLVYATSPLLQALPAIFFARRKKIPVYLWVQDLWPDALAATGFIKNAWLLACVRRIVRDIYRKSDYILIQSEGFRQSIEALVDDPKKILYYPNPAEDLSQLEPLAVNCPIAMEIKQHFSIVFAGNIGKAQSCETLVLAAEKLRQYPDIKLYFVGDGSAAASIAADIKAKGLRNITMTGHVSSDKMPAIYSAASVLWLSLKSDSGLMATIPSKLQSYLSVKKPIIASLSGEAARIIEEANAGLCCPSGDVDALVKAIVTIYHMSAEARVEIGACGYHYFKKHFDLNSQTKKLRDYLYQNLT